MSHPTTVVTLLLCVAAMAIPALHDAPPPPSLLHHQLSPASHLHHEAHPLSGKPPAPLSPIHGRAAASFASTTTHSTRHKTHKKKNIHAIDINDDLNMISSTSPDPLLSARHVSTLREESVPVSTPAPTVAPLPPVFTFTVDRVTAQASNGQEAGRSVKAEADPGGAAAQTTVTPPIIANSGLQRPYGLDSVGKYTDSSIVFADYYGYQVGTFDVSSKKVKALVKGSNSSNSVAGKSWGAGARNAYTVYRRPYDGAVFFVTTYGARWLRMFNPSTGRTIAAAGSSSYSSAVDSTLTSARFAYITAICGLPVEERAARHPSTSAPSTPTPTGPGKIIDREKVAVRAVFAAGSTTTAADDKGRGTVYVADYSAHAVRQVDFDNNRVRTVSGRLRYYGFSTSVNNARYNRPFGLAPASYTKRQLYVTDGSNQLLRFLDLDKGTSPIVAGRRNVRGFVDGALGTGTLYDPRGLTRWGDVVFIGQSRVGPIRMYIMSTKYLASLNVPATPAPPSPGGGVLTPRDMTKAAIDGDSDDLFVETLDDPTNSDGNIVKTTGNDRHASVSPANARSLEALSVTAAKTQQGGVTVYQPQFLTVQHHTQNTAHVFVSDTSARDIKRVVVTFQQNIDLSMAAAEGLRAPWEDPTPDSSSSAGLIVGIVLGIVAVCVAAVAGIALFLTQTAKGKELLGDLKEDNSANKTGYGGHGAVDNSGMAAPMLETVPMTELPPPSAATAQQAASTADREVQQLMDHDHVQSLHAAVKAQEQLHDDIL